MRVRARLGSEAWARFTYFSRRYVLLQEVACAVTREALPVPVLDQWRCVIFAASCRGEEASHQPSGLRQQGREPFAPALAEEPDKRGWGESDIEPSTGRGAFFTGMASTR